MTLEEFTALMKGELSGRDPMEAVRLAFAALSRPTGGRGVGKDDAGGGITFDKLKAVCREFEVRQFSFCAFQQEKNCG